nr:tetratricopeptide repeat protein [Chloroflexota bacterium]
RATLAWSYALLDADERALFARLSVFVGGATLEAIEAVCSPTGDGSFDVLDGVGALLDQSLLRRVEDVGGERRWGMLETIRAYAQEILAVGGNEQRVAEAHARYFLALAEDASRAFGRPGHEAWFDRLEREHGNLRAALGWLLERGDAVGALRLAGQLWRFWYARGHLTEGRRWAGRALAASADDARADPAATALRASMLIGAGILATNQGDMADAIALYDEALALYEAAGDRAGRVSTLNGLGWMLFEQGDYARAATILEEALAEADDLRQAGEAAEALLNLGHIALARGDQAHASHRYETALGRYRALGNRRGESYGLLNLGWVRVAQRTDSEAVAFFRAALVIMQSLGDVWGQASCLEGLAVATLPSAPDRARVAVVICAAAAMARAVIGAAPSEVTRAQIEAALARARAALGADSYVAAWGEGQAIDLEQATALAAAT